MAVALSSFSAKKALKIAVIPLARSMSTGEYGSGLGKGGGGGGHIRSAGGKFGEMEAAREEEYFRKLQAKQLDAIKQHQQEVLDHYEEEIRRHEENIQEHQDIVRKIRKNKQELQKKMSHLD